MSLEKLIRSCMECPIDQVVDTMNKFTSNFHEREPSNKSPPFQQLFRKLKCADTDISQSTVLGSGKDTQADLPSKNPLNRLVFQERAVNNLRVHRVLNAVFRKWNIIFLFKLFSQGRHRRVTSTVFRAWRASTARAPTVRAPARGRAPPFAHLTARAPVVRPAGFFFAAEKATQNARLLRFWRVWRARFHDARRLQAFAIVRRRSNSQMLRRTWYRLVLGVRGLQLRRGADWALATRTLRLLRHRLLRLRRAEGTMAELARGAASQRAFLTWRWRLREDLAFSVIQAASARRLALLTFREWWRSAQMVTRILETGRTLSSARATRVASRVLFVWRMRARGLWHAEQGARRLNASRDSVTVISLWRRWREAACARRAFQANAEVVRRRRRARSLFFALKGLRLEAHLRRLLRQQQRQRTHAMLWMWHRHTHAGLVASDITRDRILRMGLEIFSAWRSGARSRQAARSTQSARRRHTLATAFRVWRCAYAANKRREFFARFVRRMRNRRAMSRRFAQWRMASAHLTRVRAVEARAATQRRGRVRASAFLAWKEALQSARITNLRARMLLRGRKERATRDAARRWRFATARALRAKTACATVTQRRDIRQVAACVRCWQWEARRTRRRAAVRAVLVSSDHRATQRLAFTLLVSAAHVCAARAQTARTIARRNLEAKTFWQVVQRHAAREAARTVCAHCIASLAPISPAGGWFAASHCGARARSLLVRWRAASAVRVRARRRIIEATLSTWRRVLRQRALLRRRRVTQAQAALGSWRRAHRRSRALGASLAARTSRRQAARALRALRGRLDHVLQLRVACDAARRARDANELRRSFGSIVSAWRHRMLRKKVKQILLRSRRYALQHTFRMWRLVYHTRVLRLVGSKNALRNVPRRSGSYADMYMQRWRQRHQGTCAPP
eukprot:gnl/Chilomastix_cuspidata/1204.p1 GENE.gnl/Chilomastix_cuspidata/1204~~gnl/Chilomastix_cuspidata/1204.p1  ORF type:complete len:914 (+),score=67.16 gnl/Chilomastix_cuspidata/1204:78-2819(+)